MDTDSEMYLSLYFSPPPPGRCSFREYMPSKPGKYGIKFWVACDARSSYAWKMQVYTGKAAAASAADADDATSSAEQREKSGRGKGGGKGGVSGTEKNQPTRVVLDVTEGLAGRNVTCDNFFTSYELAQRLLREKNVSLLGTIRKNKPELPAALLELRRRRVLSSRFAYTRDTTLVSYLAKKNKNVLLLSTYHGSRGLPDPAGAVRRPDGKPSVILDYNANKGGVDNLDKVVGTYSCRRMSARWPLVVFHNILDVSSYDAFVIWRELNPDWMPRRRNKRRVFLEQLGKALVAPLIERRARMPRSQVAAAVVKNVQLATSVAGGGGAGAGAGAGAGGGSGRQVVACAAPAKQPVTIPASKRKRCQVCPSKKDCKTHSVCRRCQKYICRGCALLYCSACTDFFPTNTIPATSFSSTSL